MIKVGVTGGIGSGKTIVCEIFKQLGIPVYHADDEAKKLYDSNHDLRNKIAGLLGKEVFEENHLNRKKMAELIFNNNDLLQQVNDIVHPEVQSHFITWCSKNEQSQYLILESAILLESRFDMLLDKIIAVTAPAEIRTERILKRPGMTRKIASQIMEHQMAEEMKIERSHFVIENDDQHLVIPQVLKIHSLLVNTKTDP